MVILNLTQRRLRGVTIRELDAKLKKSGDLGRLYNGVRAGKAPHEIAKILRNAGVNLPNSSIVNFISRKYHATISAPYLDKVAKRYGTYKPLTPEFYRAQGLRGELRIIYTGKNSKGELVRKKYDITPQRYNNMRELIYEVSDLIDNIESDTEKIEEVVSVDKIYTV